MPHRMAVFLIVGMWLLVTVIVIVIGYPLAASRIRVGLQPVSRDTAPKAFWSAYFISVGLFIAVSFAIYLVLRAALAAGRHP